MPNQLDEDGLQTESQAELLAQLSAGLVVAYGSGITTELEDPSAPDTQWINLIILAALDVEDFLALIYTSFDPDQANGVQLDFRCSINNVQRQGGTFSRTQITLVTTQSVNLFGIDQTEEPAYTVSDNSGNKWQLVSTTSLGAGTNSLLFQAVVPGRVLAPVDTISVPVTIVLGVSSVNNPAIQSVIGEAQESDAALKIRRQQATQAPSQGFYNPLKTALGNIPGVTYVNVDVNYGNTTNANGTPAHSIHVVMGGTFSAAAVAAAIYAQQGWGGMVGTQSFLITQVDGTQFRVVWDDVTPELLYYQFTATSIDGINAPKLQQILEELPGLYNPSPAAEVNVNQLATLVQEIDPNCLVTNDGVSASSSGPFTKTLKTTSIVNQFILETQNINILPIEVLPATVNLVNGATQAFNAYGGTQTYTWSVMGGGVGGTINPTTGLYTAPASGTGTDTIVATDGNSQTGTAIVSVT